MELMGRCGRPGIILGAARRQDLSGDHGGELQGAKWPAPSTKRSTTWLKNFPRRSDQARGNSGSRSGHKTVVGAGRQWLATGPFGMILTART
jgi:hypothetical protein